MMQTHSILYAIVFTTVFSLTLPGCSNDSSNEPHTILPAAYDLNSYLPRLQMKNVAVVVNHTSLIGETHLVDTLLAQNISVVSIFTPEHGFSGNADAGASISDMTYGNAKIPIISLYGKRMKPRAEDLNGVDMVVFDIQDVGVRTYTYISTLHYIMEACARYSVPLLILDRPNPNGHYVDGPVLDMKYKSFVGMHPVPLVHGLTIGEYAEMINGEYWLPDSLQCNLEVVHCPNYSHSGFYSLPVPPSPNLKTMQSVYLYPSLVLFEGTVVSVGRGTDKPFMIYGHPNYPDHDFSFTPEPLEGSSMNPKLKNQKCYGKDLSGISVDSLRNNQQFTLRYLIDMYDKLDTGSEFFIPFFDQLAGTAELRKQIEAHKTEAEIKASWKDALNAYKKIRVKYLLYPDFE